MTKEHIPNKDYFIQKRVPISLQTKFDEWRQIRNLPFGKEGRSKLGDVILDAILNETSFLNRELIEKLEKIFIEGNYKEKVNFIVDRFLEWHKKFPYLTIQRAITPEDAGFPLCPFVKAIYWKGEFLGFHCRAIKPPALKLPTIRVGRLSLQVTTPEDCWDCIELCKQKKIGLDFFGHISMEQITSKKEQTRLRKATKSEYEKAISEKLKKGGMNMDYNKAKAIFENLTYLEDTKTWKGLSEASKATGTSRPTIYKLLDVFPKGLR
jgi:hypothetical protein